MENNSFILKIEDLVKEILVQNSIPYYRLESVFGTAGQDGEKSSLPMLRIVTFFEDTVSKIAEVLHSEFELNDIKEAKNIDTPVFDTYSYKRAHFLAGLRADRQAITEYRRIADKKFEIQVCSVLQDAWISVGKELGYTNTAIPEEVKRDFYRVSALLEMAETEFVKIKSLLGKNVYQAPAPSVKKPEPVAEQPAPNTFAEHLRAVVNDTPETVSAPAAAQAAPVNEEAQTAPAQQPVAEKQKIELESMDMSVDSLNSLAMNVNKIGEKNGITDESISNLITVNTNNTQATPVAHEEAKEIVPVAQVEDVPAEVAATAPEEISPVAATGAQAAPQAGEGVALNIDNIQTFNMNVNGMIEKTTEIIRESAPKDAPAEKGMPFYLEEAKLAAAAPADENAPMTDASLREYVQNSKVLKEIDAQIAERAGAKLNPEIDIEGDVDRLKFLKVFTIKQLHDRILDNGQDIVAFAEKWIGKDNGGSFDSGICLFYLEYLLVGKKNDPAFAVEYVVKFISDNDYSARYIIPTYNSIQNTEPAASHAHLTLR